MHEQLTALRKCAGAFHRWNLSSEPPGGRCAPEDSVMPQPTSVQVRRIIGHIVPAEAAQLEKLLKRLGGRAHTEGWHSDSAVESPSAGGSGAARFGRS
jgi:hypothetical protein